MAIITYKLTTQLDLFKSHCHKQSLKNIEKSRDKLLANLCARWQWQQLIWYAICFYIRAANMQLKLDSPDRTEVGCAVNRKSYFGHRKNVAGSAGYRIKSVLTKQITDLSNLLLNV